MRTRMAWEWVRGYPVFIYTTFLDHNVFDVKIVKGRKGTQNAPGFGPNSKPWKKYIQRGVASKDQVVSIALKKIENWLYTRGE